MSDMRILGTICARGGSKGVQSKNIRELCGKPLIFYTIDVFKRWGKTDRIICSTDSSEIAQIANMYGAETPFIRPKELASDIAAKLPVLQHALRYCEDEENERYDVVLDLQPTSPLRRPEDIDNALGEFLKTGADVLYSVVESKANPYYNMVELDDDGNASLSKKAEREFIRRQEVPKVYTINGSIYVYNRDYLLNAKGLHTENERIYVMDEISSVDIDHEHDFVFVEFILDSGLFELE